MEFRAQEFVVINNENISEDGVVKDVPVLGMVSKNGRRYTEDALKTGAELYENSPLYTDHSTNSRKITEKLGVLRNVHYAEDTQQLKGDLFLLKSHTLYPHIQEDLSRNLGLFGLSHDAQLSGEKTDEGIVINKINKVFSVDLVSSPATVQNLKEEIVEEEPNYEELIKTKLDAILPDIVNNAVKEAVEARVVEELNKIGKRDYTDNDKTEEKLEFIMPTDTKDARAVLLGL